MSRAGTRELGRFQKVVYGSGELFNATSTVVILMLFLKFLTDVVGLAPLWAGLCVVAGKLWDAVSDPLIGHLSDRTKSRWGRRRVYFVLFSIPASLSFVSLWLVLDLESRWATVTYYAVAYVTFHTLSTLLNVPYQALGPELTTGYDERTSLVVVRMAFSLGGAIAAGVLPNLVVTRFVERGQPEAGHLAVSVVFGVAYALIWLLIFVVVRERSRVRSAASKTPRFLVSLRSALRNRAFRLLVGLYLCAFIALDILTAATKYFVDEYVRRPALMAAIMGSMLGCALVSLPLYLWLVARFDRRTSYVVGASVWALSLFGLFTLGPASSDALIVGVMVCVGAGVAAAFVVPWSALPEVIDLHVVRNGRAEEGIYAGVMTFLRKATTTLAIFGIALSLEAFGYRRPDELGGAPQPASALACIRVFSTIVPAALVVGSIAIALRYPVTKRAHRLIRRKLDAPEELSAQETAEIEAFLDRAYGR
jgi:sugar (glycoside-pentoside-hexuronide) transporter